MAKVRFAAIVGAAAFSAGVALAAPLPTAIADADGPGASSPADDAPAQPAPARRPATAHPAAPKPATTRAGFDRSGVETPVLAPRRGSGVADTTAVEFPSSLPIAKPAAVPPREAAVTAVPPASPVAQRVSLAPVTATVSEQTPAAGVPATISSPSEPAPVSAAAITVVAPAVTSPTAATPSTVPPARSAPRALAVATVTPGVSADASSSASLIDSLLAPIRTIFGEGTALLVRRTLFNQAPSVVPVQLTGQSEGPITGTIGAVDPDGDVLTYSITGTPQHGAAVVNSDGSYSYTPATSFAGNDSFVVAVTDTGFHLNLLDLFRPASTSASVAGSQGALASMLRFQFVYGAGSQYWSSAARSALESAATQLSSYVVVTSPITITYAVTGESSPFSSTLASAGSDFINDGSGFLQTVVQSKIQSGNDANGSTADGTIDWNFGRSWAFGSSVSGSEYDFQSTAMHELLHTFGFLSNIEQPGSNTGRIWTLYDSYVVNAAGTRAINPGDFTWNTAFNPNLTGGNGGLYFNGPHAVAANGSSVALYTPSPWASGSSLSHISAGTLMNANVSTGLGPRVLSPVELGVLADIGYSVNTTPVLLFVGIVTIRQRRRRD